jgi:hypothetical protein
MKWPPELKYKKENPRHKVIKTANGDQSQISAILLVQIEHSDCLRTHQWEV